jgi:peptidyl-tRNA hydrolase
MIIQGLGWRITESISRLRIGVGRPPHASLHHRVAMRSSSGLLSSSIVAMQKELNPLALHLKL